MQRKNVLNSPGLLELKKRRRRVFFRKIFVSFFLISVIFASLAYISHTPGLNINAITITGNQTVSSEAIKTFIEKELEGNYIWFFPKTNILFYPKNELKNKLSLQFQRLKDVILSIKNNETLEVKLTERVGLYTWCGNNPEENISVDKKCYFLDKDGYIFDEAPYFSGEVYFKFYGSAKVGDFFSKKNFQQLIYLKGALTAIKLRISSIYLLEDNDLKIFLSGSAGKAFIFIKADSDFQNMVENLQTALNTEPLLSQFKNKYSSLEYIDLRFGNKVYYKFK